MTCRSCPSPERSTLTSYERTSRRIDLDNWDRSAINLPFSRMGLVAGGPIRVPPDADDATLEATRQQVESELNRVTARAYEIADRTGSDRS